MKSGVRRVVVVLISLAWSVAIHAAPKVGIVLKGHTPFWDEVAAGAKAAAGDAGVETIVKLPPNEDSVSVQLGMINSMTVEGAEALIVAPINPEIVKAAVGAQAQRGAKIVVIDSPLVDKSWATDVGTDQTAAGVATGQLLASMVGDGDEVCVFRTSQTNTATKERETAALNTVLTAHPGVIAHGDIYSGSDATAAVERANALLDKYPKTKVIFASSSTGTLAMLHTLERRKLSGAIKLIGFGFNLDKEIADALEAGAIHGWIAQLPRDVGRRAVLAAASLLKGEAVPPAVHTDFFVITKDNLHEPKVQALLN